MRALAHITIVFAARARRAGFIRPLAVVVIPTPWAQPLTDRYRDGGT
jgi:hypothetical protein